MRRLLAAALAALFLMACGGSHEPEAVARKVDPELAPDEAADGALKLFENTEDGIRDAFAGAGETSLIADGRLWEIRRAERLVGTLQISTVATRVDLTQESARRAIVRDILVGESTRIIVDDIEVATASVLDKAMYVWFGADVLQVLTIKGFDEVEPDEVLKSIIDHQTGVASWEPLPVVLTDRRP